MGEKAKVGEERGKLELSLPLPFPVQNLLGVVRFYASEFLRGKKLNCCYTGKDGKKAD